MSIDSNVDNNILNNDSGYIRVNDILYNMKIVYKLRNRILYISPKIMIIKLDEIYIKFIHGSKREYNK